MPTNRLNKLNYKLIAYTRKLHSSNYLSSPHPNDADKLYEKVSELEREWHEIDGEIEELTKKIQREEEEFETAEGETELSKYAGAREQSKDRLVGAYDKEKDSALIDRNNFREYKSMILDLIALSGDEDIKTLEAIQEQLSGHESTYEEITEMIDRLNNQKDKAAQLIEEYHENDLAPIASTSTDTPQNFAQDSSDVHQTDFNSFEPGEE